MNSFFGTYVFIGFLFGLLDIYIMMRSLNKLKNNEKFSCIEEAEFAQTMSEIIGQLGGEMTFLLMVLTSIIGWPVTVYMFFAELIFGDKSESN